MEESRLKEFYRVLGFTATTEILKCIAEGKDQYKDFDFASVSTINTRLSQLLDLGLVEHYLVKEDKRKEWYRLTEMGKNVVIGIQYLDKAISSD
jgi:DNA-binding HxlR family transcriptional regulator